MSACLACSQFKFKPTWPRFSLFTHLAHSVLFCLAKFQFKCLPPWPTIFFFVLSWSIPSLFLTTWTILLSLPVTVLGPLQNACSHVYSTMNFNWCVRGTFTTFISVSLAHKSPLYCLSHAIILLLLLAWLTQSPFTACLVHLVLHLLPVCLAHQVLPLALLAPPNPTCFPHLVFLLAWLTQTSHCRLLSLGHSVLPSLFACLTHLVFLLPMICLAHSCSPLCCLLGPLFLLAFSYLLPFLNLKCK